MSVWPKVVGSSLVSVCTSFNNSSRRFVGVASMYLLSVSLLYVFLHHESSLAGNHQFPTKPNINGSCIRSITKPPSNYSFFIYPIPDTFDSGASVPKEDEYHFLSEEDEDDDLVDLVHPDGHLILDLDQEAHDNCINADLLQAAVQAVVNNNQHQQQQQQQQTKSATFLHKHRNQSSAQVKNQHRTFRRKSSCSPDAQHHNSVAKFVDTNSSPTSSPSSSLSSSLAIIGGNSAAATTGIVGGSSTNNSHSVALATTGSTLLSKLGPSHLGKKFSQLRSKGTENLQREALRKSNEQAVAAATGKCIDHSQRYIRLPPSPHSKKFPTSVNQPNFSVNNSKNNSPGAVVHSANSCDSIARTKAKLSILQTQQQQSIQSVSANPSPIVSRSSSGRSNKSCCSSPTPPSGNKHHSSGILLHKAQNHHLTTQPPPPSLVPRSANNPPPRPKADKPNKSNMSSSSTTTSRHNVAAAGAGGGDVASSSTMMILCPTNSTNNGSTATTATTSTSSKKNIDCLSQSQNGESSTTQRLTTSSCHHPLVSSSTCSSSSQQQQQQQQQQPTSTTALISSSRQTSTLGVMNPQQCATGNPHIMQQQQHPAHIDAVSCSSSTASTSANNGSNTNMLPHHSHHHHHHQQFINKPPRGWLHPDQKLTDSGQGVSYTVRYIGCLGVNTSMKSLDFQTRSLIAKESINRVCEAAGLKTVDKKRRIDKRISGMLADSPNMEHAGVDANLSITISYLTLNVADTGQPLAKHEMPNISFASGGDTDTLDFAAYVAKDSRFERACFVLECEGGRAQEVITTIGQAFELRFNEFLKRNPLSSSHESSNHSNITNVSSIPASRIEDREYYNDLPGKIPPDIISLNHTDKDNLLNGTTSNAKVIPVAAPRNKNNKSPLTIAADTAPNQINLIDLNDDTVNGCSVGENRSKTSASSGAANLLAKLLPNDPQYVNCMSEMADKDPFDMQPFNNALASHVSSSSTIIDDQSKSVPNPNQTKSASSSTKSNSNTTSVTDNPSLKYVLNSDLPEEEWFHGPISRKDSETLVIRDGDFLVRESQASPGQYVLTGMQGGSRKHLLLVDPEGVVRTKDKTFDSVSHLINYHRNNGLPIISSESALILKNPIIVPAKNL